MSEPLDPTRAPSQPMTNNAGADVPIQTDTTMPVQTLPLRFTGSGSEYFRIWIVNLLLTLVTLTLYWPFARARRLIYFHNNTLVGQDALGFHADPWKMLRGYLLMLGLGGIYWGVSHFVPAMSWAPLLVLAALWPALWRSSLIFRLRNTSWRGVRFDFQGSSREAYAVMLPLFLPTIVLVASGSLSQVPELAEKTWVQTLLIVAGFTTLAFLLVFPWLMARMHAYQHSGYVFTAQRTVLAEKKLTGPLYWLTLKLFGMLVGLVAAAVLVMVTVGSQVYSTDYSQDLGGALTTAFAVMGLLYLLVPLVLWPYFQTRVQNLLWGNTRSEQITIRSALRFGAMFKLHMVNWLLILVTLGLYWPFAAVRTARLRLEAVSLEVQGDVNTWTAQATQQQPGVLGDAAGDFFGVDMGL